MPAHRDFARDLHDVPQTTPALRAARKRMSRELAACDRATVIGVAQKLLAAGCARFVAYELILNHKASMASITRREIERLGGGMQDWSDVDAFACCLAGPAWRERRIADAAIRAWSRSGDWCWRRAALVSTVPLNSRARGGTGDAERTLAVCERLLSDRHDLVVKAMSWALRELGKRDPASVRRFLSEHRDRIAPLVRREVGNKLTTGLKNPRGARV